MSTENKKVVQIINTDDHDFLVDCSLVLTAVEIQHTLAAINSSFTIYVAAEDEVRAKYHLAAYEQENLYWPPPQAVAEKSSANTVQPPTVIVIGALAVLYAVTGPWTAQSPWFLHGAGNSGAIIAGREYFRLVTALTLHADLTHLLGNCFIGGFLLHFFLKLTGSGVGLAAVLLSAVLGNLINVYLHGEGHHFVGFSTAVFATIGMFVMISYKTNRRSSGYQVLLPFMAGAALLAMLGSSGVRTDLGAHLFGLLSGCIIGRLLLTRPIVKLGNSQAAQVFLFLLAISIVVFCWTIALSGYRVFL